MSKRFLLILLACVVVLGGIFWLGGKDEPSSSSNPTNHLYGNGKKNVTLLEYGDFQCTVCGAFYPTLKQVKDKYKEDIYFQFRNLPLSQIHPNAFAASRAAEAASMQDKFWEMHDLLYENQSTWSASPNPTSSFEAMAQQLGLDLERFRKDFASSTVNSLINADMAAFGQTKAELATPTFFINGTKIENKDVLDSATQVPSLQKFSAIIDAEISKKNP